MNKTKNNNKKGQLSQAPIKKEKPALSPLQILSCVIPTDLIFRIAINPLEIARVRISKDLMSCTPSSCASPNGKPISCPHCLPTRSVPGVIYHIARNEGANVLLNGLQAGMKTGFIRGGIFYPLYEYGKYKLLLSDVFLQFLRSTILSSFDNFLNKGDSNLL